MAMRASAGRSGETSKNNKKARSDMGYGERCPTSGRRSPFSVAPSPAAICGDRIRLGSPPVRMQLQSLHYSIYNAQNQQVAHSHLETPSPTLLASFIQRTKPEPIQISQIS